MIHGVALQCCESSRCTSSRNKAIIILARVCLPLAVTVVVTLAWGELYENNALRFKKTMERWTTGCLQKKLRICIWPRMVKPPCPTPYPPLIVFVFVYMVCRTNIWAIHPCVDTSKNRDSTSSACAMTARSTQSNHVVMDGCCILFWMNDLNLCNSIQHFSPHSAVVRSGWCLVRVSYDQ